MAALRMSLLLIAVCAVYMIDSTFSLPQPSYVHSYSGNGSGRDALVRMYFKQGYSYKNIVLMLTTLHGVRISLRTLKRILNRLKLKKRVAISEELTRSVIEAVRKETTESGK